MKKRKIIDILKSITFSQPLNLNQFKILFRDIYSSYHLSQSIKDNITLSISIYLNQSLSDFWKDKYFKINLNIDNQDIHCQDLNKDINISQDNLEISYLSVNQDDQINLSKDIQFSTISVNQDNSNNDQINISQDNVLTDNVIYNNNINGKIKKKKIKINKRNKVNQDYPSNDPDDYSSDFFKNDYIYINRRKVEVLDTIQEKTEYFFNLQKNQDIDNYHEEINNLLDLFNYSIAFYDTHIMLSLSLYIMKYFMENNIAFDQNFNEASLKILLNTSWISNYDKKFLEYHYIEYKKGEPFDFYINSIDNFHKYSHKFKKIKLQDLNNE